MPVTITHSVSSLRFFKYFSTAKQYQKIDTRENEKLPTNIFTSLLFVFAFVRKKVILGPKTFTTNLYFAFNRD